MQVTPKLRRLFPDTNHHGINFGAAKLSAHCVEFRQTVHRPDPDSMLNLVVDGDFLYAGGDSEHTQLRFAGIGIGIGRKGPCL